MAEVTDMSSEGTPTDDWPVGHMRCLRKLEAMRRTIEANARRDGNAEIVAEMRRRHGYIESAKREVAVGWLRARRHAPTHAARPRPRVRARRTRTAARRAGGCRSGSDPGDGSGSSEGDGESDAAARLRYKLERLGLLRPRDPWGVGWSLGDRPMGGFWPIRILVTLAVYRLRDRAMRLAARWQGLP